MELDRFPALNGKQKNASLPKAFKANMISKNDTSPFRTCDLTLIIWEKYVIILRNWWLIDRIRTLSHLNIKIMDL